MKTLSSRTLVALGLALGLAVGWTAARMTAPAPASAALAASPAPAVHCTAVLADEQLAQLRAELARPAPAVAERAPAPAAQADAPEPAPEPSAEPSAESLAAEEAAHRHLELALARGTWTRDDRATLRNEILQLTQRQTEALMSTLVLALNEGRLRQDQPGPLF